VWRWENQEPFGNNPPEENPSGVGNFEFPLRFPGQYFDAETGLFYNMARDYDPGTGRYIQPEPLGIAGDINLYRYARNNPLSFIDPDGNQATAAVPAVGGFSTAPGIGAAGSRAISVLGPFGAVVGAGLGGYEIGALIYQRIEPALSKAIDWCVTANSDIDRCKSDCIAANETHVRTICKMLRSPRAREQCYREANEIMAKCLVDCERKGP
jgi:RHS repeat-associated protein